VSSDDLPDKQGRLALKAQQSGNMRLGKSAPICSLIEDIRDNLDGLPAFGKHKAGSWKHWSRATKS
tara:strand:+ start:779 stop:976 length:198 start_codon:yes stop_codon:yes gene_type:complete